MTSYQITSVRYLCCLCALLFLGMPGCGDPADRKQDDPAKGTDSPISDVPSGWSNPTEIFTGTANDARIRFEHLNYTRYRLVIALDTLEGNLNTERGFADDEDATLYILEGSEVREPIWHFVRMTNGGILMLDKNRKPLPDTRFQREK